MSKLVVDAEWLSSVIGMTQYACGMKSGKITPLTPAQERAGDIDKIGANRLAYVCACQIVSGKIDPRSGIGDALLHYLKIGQPGECDSVPEWMRKHEALATPQGKEGEK